MESSVVTNPIIPWLGGKRRLPELGRYASVASFIAEASGQESKRLLDVDIAWIGKDRLALDGIHRKAAYRNEPEALYEGSWLYFYEARVVYEDTRRYGASKDRR
jgi:hypothetical protein